MAEPTPEERRARARRALEVLETCGWAIDELVTTEQRRWLTVETVDAREECFRNATAAIGLKAHLMGIVNAQKGQEAIDERREQRAS